MSRPFVAIQHHPSRADLLPRLIDRLDGFDHAVVSDDGPTRDPWRGHQACLQRFSSEIHYSHLVVIQDDAIPCPAFSCELGCALEVEPDATLVLFLAAQPRLTARSALEAFDAGEPFCDLNPRDYLPVVAVCYPADHVASILEWAAAGNGRQSRSDDYMLGRWHREVGARVRVSVPSLVDHPDDVPSVIGNGQGSHGMNPSRVAMVYLVDDQTLRAV